MHGWCHVQKHGSKNPSLEVKLYSSKFIALSASVTFYCSLPQCLWWHWTVSTFVFPFSFLGKTWSSRFAWIPWKTRLQGMSRESWRTKLINAGCRLFMPLVEWEARDQGHLDAGVHCLGQGQYSSGLCQHSNMYNWRAISAFAHYTSFQCETMIICGRLSLYSLVSLCTRSVTFNPWSFIGSVRSTS